MRKFLIILSGVGVIVLGIVIMNILASLKEPPEKKPVIDTKKYVDTQPVSYTEVPTEIVAFGRVRTAESLDLIAERSGRMFQGNIRLKEGQSFRKGTLLFKIDDTEAKLNLSAQKSNFMRDLAAILPDLKIDFSDNYAAWESYFNSLDIDKQLPELPQHKSNKEKTFLATKNIFSNYYNIKSAEANLRKHYFYAPFDGNISTVNLQSGSFVNPGNNIARIIRTGRLELKVDVDVDDISWINVGAPATVTTEGSTNQWNGVVSRIGEFVNQQTQSIDVFIAIQPNKSIIYDGQYLEASIPGEKIENGMIIPRNAIFNKNEVFVVEDTLLRVRKVDIHKTNPETVVFSGLEEGADLVIEPLVNAHNDMVVYKLEDKEEKDIDLEKKESKNTKLVKN
ncbi:MAG: efflux RND transporter periplasmic adaptor subunit [Bacteroidota bacterium]